MITITKPLLSSDIKVAFSYTSASPVALGIVGVGKRIISASVILDIPFDGSAPEISLGIAGFPELLIAANELVPKVSAEYNFSPNYVVTSSPIMLLLYIDPDGSTAGSGTILIETI